MVRYRNENFNGYVYSKDKVELFVEVLVENERPSLTTNTGGLRNFRSNVKCTTITVSISDSNTIIKEALSDILEKVFIKIFHISSKDFKKGKYKITLPTLSKMIVVEIGINKKQARLCEYSFIGLVKPAKPLFEDIKSSFSDIDLKSRVKKPKSDFFKCQSCKNSIPKSAKFCPECGYSIHSVEIPTPVKISKPVKITCQGCKTHVSKSVKFCPECGLKILDTESAYWKKNSKQFEKKAKPKEKSKTKTKKLNSKQHKVVEELKAMPKLNEKEKTSKISNTSRRSSKGDIKTTLSDQNIISLVKSHPILTAFVLSASVFALINPSGWLTIIFVFATVYGIIWIAGLMFPKKSD